MMKTLRVSAILLVLFSTVLGLGYPLLITGFGQLLFPFEANGSLLSTGGRVVGSLLVGQEFTSDHYFWGRPSATSLRPYNAAASSGSNLGPSNPALLASVRQRARDLPQSSGSVADSIPMDLVTSSASGLDPHISPEAALYQVPRVAKARGMAESAVRTLVEQSVEGSLSAIPGMPHVNVLVLNLALDRLERGGK